MAAIVTMLRQLGVAEVAVKLGADGAYVAAAGPGIPVRHPGAIIPKLLMPLHHAGTQ